MRWMEYNGYRCIACNTVLSMPDFDLTIRPEAARKPVYHEVCPFCGEIDSFADCTIGELV